MAADPAAGGSPDLAEQLRRCQEGLVGALRAREDAEAALESARAELGREVARRERLEARLEHVQERADRLEELVDSIRGSKAWKAIEAYRSTVTRLRP